MPCSKILPKIVKDCAGNVGGVKAVFIMNKGTAAESRISVSGNTFAISGSSGMGFVRYETPRGAASFGTSAVINRETGANYFDNSVTLVVNKLTPDGKAAQLLESLTLGEFVIIVQDNNDVCHLIGFLGEGAMATDGSSTTGAALTDRNGETITLTAGEPAPAPTADYEDIKCSIVHDIIC